MNFKTNLFLSFKTLLPIIIGGVLFYFVYQNQQDYYYEQCILRNLALSNCNFLDKLIVDFQQIEIKWIIGAMLIYLVSKIGRTFRWMQLLEPLGQSPRFVNSFFSIMLGTFANLGLSKIGELIRPITLSKYENIPIEKVLGTILMERFIDILSLLLILVLIFITNTNVITDFFIGNKLETKKITFLLYIIIGICSVFYLAYFLFIWNKTSLVKTKFYIKFQSKILNLWKAFLTIKSITNIYIFIAYSFIIWLSYFGMIYLLLMSFEPTSQLNLASAFIIFSFGLFSIFIPSPGGVGSYHFLIITALSIYDIIGIDAFVFANIVFFIPHICNIIFGLLGIIFLPRFNKNYFPRHISS